MEDVLSRTFQNLSEEQLKFISKETGLSQEALFSMTEEELYKVYDSICDIEIDEACEAGEDDLSERGEAAAEIVTVIGNAIRDAEGYDDEEEKDG